jgi:hypothetical protein
MSEQDKDKKIVEEPEDSSGKPSIHIGGKVTGGIVGIGSTQTFHGNLTINYGTLNNAPEGSPQEELKKLLTELEAKLKEAPAEQAEAVAAVQSLANTAAEQASQEKPNKTMLKITGEGLKQAAENLLAVAPIAVQIAKTLLLIG